MKMTKQEKSWVMFDWANSSYATIMMAAVFPVYFSGVCAAGGQEGDFWWGVGTAVATGVIAVLAPFIGAVADYKGYKKKLFNLFLAIGLIFTLSCAFTGQWKWMLLGYILSRIGFAGSGLVYDSFLTDVTTTDRMDQVSSWGYAMGYIGGSTIPFIASIVLVSFGSSFGIDASMAVRISIVITVLWWGIFSIPFMKNVHQNYGMTVAGERQVRKTFAAIGRTTREIAGNRGLLIFILAYFCYIDGVGTVINMATSYGATLGLGTAKMMIALLLTQFVAFPCSVLFGKMSGKFGALRMILWSIGIYLLICICGFIMGFGVEESFLSVSQAEILFWIMAVMVGTVQGGIQAISRSYYGKLVPPEKSGEYFGFYDIFGKFAAVLGPVLYSATKALTGRSSLSILSVILLFFIALILLIGGRKHLVK